MIYDRQTIALLMRLCKLMSGEFGIRLHLDDPEIISKISALLVNGASAETLSTWHAVRRQIALDEVSVASPPVRRSPAPDRPVPSPAAPGSGPNGESRPRPVRIYRGQIVH